MTLDKDTVPAKDVTSQSIYFYTYLMFKMLVSTTVVVICFTVFVQVSLTFNSFNFNSEFKGVTIKPLVKFLRVKTQEPSQSAVTSFIFTNVSLAQLN
jgi:hypothetical protein